MAIPHLLHISQSLYHDSVFYKLFLSLQFSFYFVTFFFFFLSGSRTIKVADVCSEKDCSCLLVLNSCFLGL